MIEVRLDDGVTPVYLPRVDHLSSAQEAATTLWNGVLKQANVHGGAAELLTPADLGHRYAVRWVNGPNQWAQAYVVSEGSEAREFVTTADDAFTVGFSELDS